MEQIRKVFCHSHESIRQYFQGRLTEEDKVDVVNGAALEAILKEESVVPLLLVVNSGAFRDFKSVYLYTALEKARAQRKLRVIALTVDADWARNVLKADVLIDAANHPPSEEPGLMQGLDKALELLRETRKI